VIDDGDAVTIHQVLIDAVSVLSAASDTPQLDAEILLAYVLQQPRSYLRGRPDRELTNEQSLRYTALLARRMQREPVAYLIGRKEFWSLDLEVSAETLIPRPDTEILIEAALQYFPEKNQHITVADLGTGSGAIALALQSERPNWEIHAVDSSAAALIVARNNAQRLGLMRVSFYVGNWFTALPARKLDLVVSNPPYLSEKEWPSYSADLAYEPRAAFVSGNDGLDAIREICTLVRGYIRTGGYLMIEHGFTQGSAVRELFVTAGCGQVTTVKDLSGQERVTIGRF
jgi:release factor glutamine methyltransferase